MVMSSVKRIGRPMRKHFQHVKGNSLMSVSNVSDEKICVYNPLSESLYRRLAERIYCI